VTLFPPRPRIILMIGDDGVIAVPHEIPHAAPIFAPSEDKPAVQEIIAFIEQNPLARLTLFADTLSQDYRCEDLPPLNFFDRMKLIKRRLKQAFPSAQLTTYLRYKNTPHRVLLIGLHESNPVFTWLFRLRKRLPEIALLPVEGARLSALLMPEATNGWALLVSRQKSGGFRQIVTFKNDLVFTRLTPLPPTEDPDNEAEIIARDIKASLDYLTRQGLRNPNELSVLLLTPDNLHDSLILKNMSLKSIRSVSPAQAAKRLGLPFGPEENDSSSDVLFAAHLASRLLPALPLMLPDAREVWLTQFVRTWGMRVSVACLAAVVVLTLWRAGDFAATLYQTQKEALRLAKTHFILAQEQAQAAPLTEPLARLRQALERRHIYERPTPMPWRGLNELAPGLDQHSQLVALQWNKNENAETESIKVVLRVINDGVPADRAETVASFSRIAQNIASAMPDYSIIAVKPPYPALPQESVTAALPVAEDPTGEILLEGNLP